MRNSYKICVAIMASLLYGCMSASHSVPRKTYEGAALTIDKEVVLYQHSNFINDLIIIDKVIYHYSYDGPGYYFTLTPGIHSIDYYYNIYNRGWATGTFSIDMEAGHAYSLKVEVDTNFHLLYSRPWEATVILSDLTDNVDLRSMHFRTLIQWDDVIRIKEDDDEK